MEIIEVVLNNKITYSITEFTYIVTIGEENTHKHSFGAI
jgi:hypothetical protein